MNLTTLALTWTLTLTPTHGAPSAVTIHSDDVRACLATANKIVREQALSLDEWSVVCDNGHMAYHKGEGKKWGRFLINSEGA